METELKTLKDFDFSACIGDKWANDEEIKDWLKKEAIKWVKACRNFFTPQGLKSGVICGDGDRCSPKN